MRFSMRAAVAAALLAAAADAQCNGFIVPTFLSSTSSTGNDLNILTPTDSTANSTLTPGAQDNQASATIGEAIAFTLSNTQGVAGAPLTLAYTPGVPTPAVAIPGGNLHLNIGLGAGYVVDGIGLFTGLVNPFIAHPGPGLNWTMGASLAAIPGIGQTCWTMQAGLLDATAPFGFRLSNAVLLSIRGQVASVVPNFGPEGSAVTVNALGTSSGTTLFETYNPAGASLTPTLASASGTLSFGVPTGAGSGPLAFEYPTNPGFPTSADPDNTTTWFAVTDPFGVLINPAVGLLTTNQSPLDPTQRHVSLTNALPNGTTVHTYSLALNAGDVVTVEAYAMNVARTAILDGFGATFNPSATEGADLLLNLTELSNALPLTFDQGAAGPFLIHGDDDSGPGFNPRLTFQVRATDTYQILLAASPANAAAFVTGDYLLNVRIKGAIPSVSKFQIPGQAATVSQCNVKAAGTTLEIVGSNFPTATPLDVIMTPLHGLHAPITISGVLPTSSTLLTFTMPTLSATSRTVGSYYVQLVDVATGARSLIWDDSFAGTIGMIPELLIMRAFTITTPVTTGALNVSTGNAQTWGIQAGAATAPPGGSFYQVAGNGTQTMYIEAYATKGASNLTPQFLALADTILETGTTPVAACWDPVITLFSPGFGQVVTFNGDDGITPTPYAWPANFSPGIGLNAAILQPLAGFAGAAPGNFIAAVTALVNYGPAITTKGYIVNIVVL